MKTIEEKQNAKNEIDRGEILESCLVPLFTNMDPGFAAIVLENMLKDYMNTPDWNKENSGRRACRLCIIGNIIGLLNDLSAYFPHE